MSFSDDRTRDPKDVDYGNGPELERGLGTYEVRRRADDLPAREARHQDQTSHEPGGWRRSDDRLRAEVSAALVRDRGIDASDIEVHVEQGDVTLKGTVADKFAKRHASHVAESVPGVTNVQNLLRVRRDGDGMEASSGRRGDREVKRRTEREGSADVPSSAAKSNAPPSSPDTLAD